MNRIWIWLLQIFICLHDLTGRVVPVQIGHIDYVGYGNNRVGSVVQFGGKYIGVTETVSEIWAKIRRAEESEESENCNI